MLARKILGDKQEAECGMRGGEAGGRPAVQCILGIGGHDGDDEHLHQRQPALHRVVGIEARGEDGVSDPRPPDQCEQWGETDETLERVVFAQWLSDLADGGDEDQVEEQFEPGDFAPGILTKENAGAAA